MSSTFSMFAWSALFQLWRATLIHFLWPLGFSRLKKSFCQATLGKCLLFGFTFSGFVFNIIFFENRSGRNGSIKNKKGRLSKLLIFINTQMSNKWPEETEDILALFYLLVYSNILLSNFCTQHGAWT